MGRTLRVENSENKVDVELVSVGARHSVIQIGDIKYECEVIGEDGTDKFVRVGTKVYVIHNIQNREFVVKGKTYRVLSLGEAQQKEDEGGKVDVIKAVMPGMVVKVLVKEGDQVKKGDALLILEAMKMENQVKSPGEGVVKSVKVKAGQAVESGDILVEFE